MLNITAGHKIYVACKPVDFRKGIDGYAALCRSQLQRNPLSGQCFLFRNKRRTAIKVLLYEGTGYWLCHKRLSKGTLKHWPTSTEQAIVINTAYLSRILSQ